MYVRKCFMYINDQSSLNLLTYIPIDCTYYIPFMYCMNVFFDFSLNFPLHFEPLFSVRSYHMHSGTLCAQFFTDTQRFPRDKSLPHEFVDDSMWYLVPPNREYIQLYKAVRHGDLESLRAALELGAINVDIRDQYNKTPLMVACAHGRLDIVSFLIDRGLVCVCVCVCLCVACLVGTYVRMYIN